MIDAWAELKRQRRKRHLKLVEGPVASAPDANAIGGVSETPPIPKQSAASGPTPRGVGRRIVGVTLIGSALVLAITSMRANVWFGYAISTDDSAGPIFSSISVTAEVIAFVLPTANRFYRGRDRLRGWLLAGVASSIVLLAAGGFVLTNLSDKAAKSSPTIIVAKAGLEDAKAARDRECIKVGPICRQREDAVVARQQELREAMADQNALSIDFRAGAFVAMCLLAGLVLSHGWGLAFGPAQ